MAKQKRGGASILTHRQSSPPGPAWPGRRSRRAPCRRTLTIPMGIPILERRPGKRRNATCRRLRWRPCCRRQGRSKKGCGPGFSGDLLNQCISSSFSLRNTGLPALGLYGACSTMAESLLLASMAVSGGFADRAVAMTSPLTSPLRSGSTGIPWAMAASGRPLPSGRSPAPAPRWFAAKGWPRCREAATVGTIWTWASPTPTTWGRPWRPVPLKPSAPTSTTWARRRRILT